MEHAAAALGILGFASGVVFPLRVLLLEVAVLLVGSLLFALAAGTGFLRCTAIIVVAQTILQSTYFLGLVARAVASRTREHNAL